jgi:nucleotide-binding universal stress UspA family protein
VHFCACGYYQNTIQLALEEVFVTNVLLAIDGSSYGKVISDFVVNHRWTSNTQLRLLHFIEPLADDVYPEVVWERAALNAAKKMLGQIAARIYTVLPAANLTQIIRQGEPKEEILREAAEWPADLIVLGSHGRPSSKINCLGSVSLEVLNKATAMVIVVRVPQERIEALAWEPEVIKNDYVQCQSV